MLAEIMLASVKSFLSRENSWPTKGRATSKCHDYRYRKQRGPSRQGHETRIAAETNTFEKTDKRRREVGRKSTRRKAEKGPFMP
jgi:hypothetical protein